MDNGHRHTCDHADGLANDGVHVRSAVAEPILPLLQRLDLARDEDLQDWYPRTIGIAKGA